MVGASWFRHRQAAAGSVGLAWVESDLAVAHIVPGDERPALERCERIPAGGGALADWVMTHGLARVPCVIVPPEEACTLRVIDAPDLPREEWVESVRWQIQDLVDFDVERAWIDVLEIPVAADWTRARKVYVLIGQRDQLARRVDLVRKAGLRPVGFEIRERALLRIADPRAEGPGVAVLDLPAKGGLLVVGDGGEVHVTRPVSLDTDAAFASDEIELEGADTAEIVGSPAFDSLLLDLQRSLDYYEAEFGRSPASRIAIAPSGEERVDLADYLHRSLRLPVELLDLRDAFPGGANPSFEEQGPLLGAVGAALSTGRIFAHELAPKPRKRNGVDLPMVGRLCAAVAVAALLQLAFERHQAGSLAAQLSELEAEQARVQQRFEVVAQQAGPEGLSPRQRAELGKLEKQRASHQQLVDALSTHGGARRSFAGVATALARSPVRGLWLTEIRVALGGRQVELAGQAEAAERVPAWLSYLEQQAELEGVGFEQVEVTRTEEGSLRFALRAVFPEQVAP